MNDEQPDAIADREPGGALILVVEDNAANARLTCAMLQAGHYRTHVATDGAEGLQCALRLRPDLILTDLQLPNVDGITMSRQLKADPRTAMIPVLALTAHAMRDCQEQALAAGCIGFLTKPIRMRPFLAEISDAFRHASVPNA